MLMLYAYYVQTVRWLEFVRYVARVNIDVLRGIKPRCRKADHNEQLAALKEEELLLLQTLNEVQWNGFKILFPNND